MSVRLSRRLLALILLLVLPVASWAASAKVYVILWFDTEDYLLPADDDAALHLANFLSREHIKATFKVVGEKARTLERRHRDDVIAALKRHEIGFHSNWHSVQPSPAMYLSTLGWDEGVAEFDRREGPGRDDVQRIFGQAPTCYGQPGSSWGPQSYGAMKKWGMGVYLDAGRHIGLDGKPCFYDGVLNLYNLDHILRTDLTSLQKEQAAEDKFTEARKALLEEGGGIVSIYYHPCEFVHKEFWDAVNFKRGANPPRELWKAPPQKTPEETQTAYECFETWIRFIHRFPEVQFITASQAARLYRDRSRGRRFGAAEIKAVAAAVGDQIDFQRNKDYTLSASEVFALAQRVCGGTRRRPRAGRPGGDGYAVRPHRRFAGNRGRRRHDRLEPVRPHSRRRGRLCSQAAPRPRHGLARLHAGIAGGVPAGAGGGRARPGRRQEAAGDH